MTIRSVLVRSVPVLGLMIAAPSGAALAQSLECNHPAPTGCFEATVTGDGASAELTGFAMSFGSAEEGAWAAQMTTPGGQAGFMLMHQGEAVPSEGEYPIGNFLEGQGKPAEGEFVASGNADLGAAVQGFQSVEGTLVVTASSSSWVEGTFSFEGQAPQTGATVSVEGRFKAKNQGM